MGSSRRRWDIEKKLLILRQAEEIGVSRVLREHGVASSTYYKWRAKYDLYGEVGLRGNDKGIDEDVKRLKLENIQLKQLLAEKELALKVKDELLKKTLSTKKSR